jgi:hypothetical protein
MAVRTRQGSHTYPGCTTRLTRPACAAMGRSDPPRRPRRSPAGHPSPIRNGAAEDTTDHKRDRGRTARLSPTNAGPSALLASVRENPNGSEPLPRSPIYQVLAATTWRTSHRSGRVSTLSSPSDNIVAHPHQATGVRHILAVQRPPPGTNVTFSPHFSLESPPNCVGRGSFLTMAVRAPGRRHTVLAPIRRTGWNVELE